MKKVVLACAALIAARGPSAPLLAQVADGQPALVVMVAVDQLREDLIDRYAEHFTGGFARLRAEGHRFQGASHAHAITETAAGHATISTGVFPSRSGIVANDWQERTPDGWVGMYAVEDSLSPIVGVTGLEGRSPRNLLRGGLADWVLAADREARVVSISAKDRSAITLAGKTRGEVYWLSKELARFVTSSYYRDRYPRWVTRFNEERMPEIVRDSVWRQEASEAARLLARPDSASYEYDGVHTTFPHQAWEESMPGVQERNEWALDAQPRSDRAVQLLAQEAIRELRLGQRDRLDYLGLSFSAADYVGHAFGPLSQEQLENLLHLDRVLGELLTFLDDVVGPGRWVLGLTADHGVMSSPEHLIASGEAPEAKRMPPNAFSRGLSEALSDAVSGGGGEDAIAERLARAVEERGLVARAYTHRSLTVGEQPDSFAILFRNSYYPGRAAGALSRMGVELRYLPHTLVSRVRGTTHGTPYWHDRVVPFVLIGAGVRAGVSERPVFTVDMAPTLARLAWIPFPMDLDGRPVYW